jgi:hypothetical protein
MMSDRLGKLEIVLSGKIEAAGPTIVAIGASFGFAILDQDVPFSGPRYKYYEVYSYEAEPTPLALGVIMISQLGERNISMVFGPISDWLGMEPVKHEYVTRFWDLMDALLRQMLILGYEPVGDSKPRQPLDDVTPRYLSRQ